MTSSPTPGHQPWGQESWNESRPSRKPMVQIWILSDEWLSRYELLKNLHIKLGRSVTWTQTRKRTTGVTTIALLVLHTGKLKNNWFNWSIWILPDEWLSRYELLKNLHIKLGRSVTWTQTRKRTTGVTTIALLVLHTGKLKNNWFNWSIWILSDEWLSRYELLKNLHIKLGRSVTWTRTRKRTTGVTTIALFVLHTGKLKNNWFNWSIGYTYTIQKF